MYHIRDPEPRWGWWEPENPRDHDGEPIPGITNVIFNDPATIVFWEDGTKTVVRVSAYERYDAEKGMAMAIIKKICGNTGRYNNLFAPWVEAYEKETLPQSWAVMFQERKLRF